MLSLTPRFFNTVGIVAAILLLPLMSYGSALLLDRQGLVVDMQPRLTKAAVPNQPDLPAELKAQIAAAIAKAEGNR